MLSQCPNLVSIVSIVSMVDMGVCRPRQGRVQRVNGCKQDVNGAVGIQIIQVGYKRQILQVWLPILYSVEYIYMHTSTQISQNRVHDQNALQIQYPVFLVLARPTSTKPTTTCVYGTRTLLSRPGPDTVPVPSSGPAEFNHQIQTQRTMQSRSILSIKPSRPYPWP